MDIHVLEQLQIYSSAARYSFADLVTFSIQPSAIVPASPPCSSSVNRRCTRKMEKFEAKMKADGLNAAAIAAFKHNYEQLVAGVDGIVAESDIEAISVRCQPQE